MEKKKVSKKSTKKKKVLKSSVKKRGKGRPTSYREEYCELMVDFFSEDPYREVETTHHDKKGGSWTTSEDKANDMPMFSKFALKIGVCHDTLCEWRKVHRDFSEAYKKCKGLQEYFLMINGLKGLYVPSFSIFTAKNICLWRDRQEIEHSGEVKHSRDDLSKMSDKELVEQIKKIGRKKS